MKGTTLRACLQASGRRVGIRQAVIKPLGEAIEYRETLKMIIHKIDPDGKRGMKKYWEFKDPEDYVRRQFDNITGLKDVGGYDFLKERCMANLRNP